MQRYQRNENIPVHSSKESALHEWNHHCFLLDFSKSDQTLRQISSQCFANQNSKVSSYLQIATFSRNIWFWTIFLSNSSNQKHFSVFSHICLKCQSKSNNHWKKFKSKLSTWQTNLKVALCSSAFLSRNSNLATFETQGPCVSGREPPHASFWWRKVWMDKIEAQHSKSIQTKK